MSGIKRSVQVMELLARKSPLGVRAVATQLALPLGSVHRLLQDLEAEGMAEPTSAGEWVLSFRLLEIAGRQLERIQLPAFCRPFAEQMATATRETVNINALSGLHGVCIDKVRGNEGMQIDLRIGAHGFLYCGGAGKAMLTYMTPADQQQVLSGPFTALTPKTIIDPAVLRAELSRIRACGYSIDDQEVVTGVYCVSVAILDGNGRPVGAINITGSSPKRPGPDVLPMVAMLNEACDHVSRRLGYRGVWPLVDAASGDERLGA